MANDKIPNEVMMAIMRLSEFFEETIREYDLADVRNLCREMYGNMDPLAVAMLMEKYEGVEVDPILLDFYKKEGK